MVSPSRPAAPRLRGATLVALAVFTATSIVGYGVYALHPERLPATGLALDIFRWSFTAFAQAHILIASAALFVTLASTVGSRWAPAFLAVASASFLAEHVGTGLGMPFGAYEYTGLLGFRIGLRVPALIPVSWFLMALPSWVVARSLFPDRRAPRVLLAALGLALWDLALDPAMSFLTPYWRWHERGAYYGMPLSNLVGWLMTGMVLAVVLDAIEQWRPWARRLPVAWMAGFYALVAALPLGMLAAAGTWGAVATTLAAYGTAAPVAYLVWARPPTQPRASIGEEARVAPRVHASEVA